MTLVLRRSFRNPATTHAVIEGVARIRLDAMTVDAVEMHARDGEIYHLSHHGNLVTPAVYWYRSPTAHPSCAVYELQGRSMALGIDPARPPALTPAGRTPI